MCYNANNKQKYMFSTSLDILYLTLSLCAAVLTFFLCWALYYFVCLERDAVTVVEKWKHLLEKAETVVGFVEEKMHSGGAYMLMAGQALKSLVEYFVEKRETKKRIKKA